MKKETLTNRIGEESINNQNLKMWIKDYRGNKEIDVEFEDGFISYNKKYIDFKNGSIQNNNYKKAGNYKGINFIDRIGEIGINKQGLKMWIEKYDGCKNINVRFEDNYLAENKRYKDFKKGLIHNKNHKCVRSTGIIGTKKIKDRVGETNTNKYGSKMTIAEYYDVHNILVLFENGYKKKTTYNEFKKGSVRNPYDKTFYGIGYLGEGNYKTSISGEHTLEYDRWRAMLSRCYNEKEKEVNKSYEGCTVCEEWLNFQNFAKWYSENYYEVEGQRMHLDKDILHKGNKIYSPENCFIVPERINILFVKNKNKRGDYPIGVHYDKKYETFVAGYNTFKTCVSLGWFNNPIEGFNAYKKGKEAYIKEVAEEYKDKIPEQLYIAMMNYIVEITD